MSRNWKSCVAAAAVLSCACVSSRSQEQASPAPADESPAADAGEPPPQAQPPPTTAAPDEPQDTAPAARSTGVVTVKGGEDLALDGATVHVKQVSYMNQPCPKAVKCVHSGVVKSVAFVVRTAAGEETAYVNEGGEKAVLGVLLRVKVVREGPQADVEASLPLRSAP